MLEFIERRLDEEGADPSHCTFEITETSQVYDYDYEAAAGFADRLTEFGCQVAIDDYGAGFGPFHYLKRIPFDLIKIDGSFVRDMPRSDADQLTVQAIVQIARGLGKTTIAEYVQDDVTEEMLREYGVDMAQGYHLGRPMDLDEALAGASSRSLDLAAVGLRQLGGELDDARELVGRGLFPDVVLQLADELVGGDSVVA